MPSGTGLFSPTDRGLVKVAMTDNSNNATLVECLVTNIPSQVAGYAVGCDLLATDTGAHYYNTGTALLASFVAVGTITAGSVLLASLAPGITPSHVVKYAGTITWSGSGASLATTVTGVATTDIVMATITVKGTQAAYLVSAAPTLNTITLVLSAANTSNDYQISYTVFRAAS
jgi:hypothetical protein